MSFCVRSANNDRKSAEKQTTNATNTQGIIQHTEKNNKQQVLRGCGTR